MRPVDTEREVADWISSVMGDDGGGPWNHCPDNADGLEFNKGGYGDILFRTDHRTETAIALLAGLEGSMVDNWGSVMYRRIPFTWESTLRNDYAHLILKRGRTYHRKKPPRPLLYKGPFSG